MNRTTPMPLLQFINSLDDRQPRTPQHGDKPTAEAWIDSIDKVDGAYIHVPFCFHKCHYCDFFSIAGADDRHEPFVDRLVGELSFIGSQMHKPLDSVFVGGGTPTLLAPMLFDRLLAAIRYELPLAPGCEWTIEANPETVTNEVAQIMAKHGVNRVSIGAQSFDKVQLKTLERWHEPESVERAVSCFRAAGIDNYNLDLIYSIPGQTISQVQDDLLRAIDLQPKHLSCYALIYEPNTPLRTRLDLGEVIRVEQDIEAEMFELVRTILHEANYLQYEISNFAMRGYECRHNLMYWKNKSWWPFGPAAAGHLDGRRWKNAPRLSEYILNEPLPFVQDVETLDDDRSAGEAFMLGLRMLKGMERTWVESLVEQSTSRWREHVIERFIKEKLLHWKSDNLALTANGILVADTVILALLMREDTMTDTSGK